MSETHRCPQCHSELPANAPAGLCPKCLLQAGFESQAGPTSAHQPTASSPSAAGFVPPTVEEIAPHFPQLEVLELLGKGGMGAVYKARQAGLDRLVAIKILPPEVGRDAAFADRFTREARALARLSHPNIVSVYDFGQSDGLFYIVMEYVDGMNLRQTIQAGAMSPPAALAVVPQICDALQYAHDEGIVHRDIKPENILLDRRGRVKIADFGLAKLFGAAADQTLTGEHQVMGTLRYMAPEQMEGTHAVDHRADIYSLGVVFYELLTGELPIGRFAPPSKKVQIDVRLDEVVLRALDKEPADRYQHASDVRTDVDAIRQSAFVAVGAPSAVEKVSDIVLARRLGIVCLVVITLAEVLFALLNWGYLSGAEWYFKQEFPYTLLSAWLTPISIMSFVFLTQWWYLRAKHPATPRSFADFVRMIQTPDPRAKKLWLPLGAFIAVWMVVMIAGFAFSDFVQTIAMSSVFMVGPYFLMAVLAQVFRPAISPAAVVGRPELRYQAVASPRPEQQAAAVRPYPEPSDVCRQPEGVEHGATGASSPPVPEQLEREVLAYLPKLPVHAVGCYRNLTGVTIAEARQAVEAIAARHGMKLDNDQARWWNILGIVLGLMVAGFFALKLDVSPLVWEPLIFLALVVPYGISAWKYRGSHRGRRDAMLAGVWLFVLIANPLLNIDPAKALKRLHEITGVKPGRNDTEFLSGLFLLSVFGFLAWLIRFWYKLQISKRTAAASVTRTLAGDINQAELLRRNAPVDLAATHSLQDQSSWVCAIIAMVLLALGLIVPAILIGVYNSADPPAVVLTLVVCMVLALVFGLLGRAYRLGRYAAVAASVVGVGLFLILAVQPSSPQGREMPPEPTIEATLSRDDAQQSEPVANPEHAEAAPSPTSQEAALTDGDKSQIEQYLHQIGLPAARQSEVNKILSGYREQYLAIERRHTKISRDEKQHIHVAVSQFSAECQTLAKRLAEELGGIVDQKYVPKVQPGSLPREIFGIGGEANINVELWKEGNTYHWSEAMSDWVSAPGMVRSDSKRAGSAGSLDGLPPEYRRFWMEE